VILKTFQQNSEPKNFDEITTQMRQKKKDRTTIYRTVNKMAEEDLLTKEIYSQKKIKYKPTLHGLCILKALEVFPMYYYFPAERRQEGE